MYCFSSRMKICIQGSKLRYKFTLPLGRVLLDACTPLGTCLHRIPDWLRWEGSSRGHLAQLAVIKQGHPQLVTQDCVQTAFEYLPGWRLPTPFWPACQCLVTFAVEKCFLMFRGALCVSVCAQGLWLWASLTRAWFCLLCILPAGIYRY